MRLFDGRSHSRRLESCDDCLRAGTVDATPQLAPNDQPAGGRSPLSGHSFEQPFGRGLSDRGRRHPSSRQRSQQESSMREGEHLSCSRKLRLGFGTLGGAGGGRLGSGTG